MPESPERDDRRGAPREVAHLVAEIELNGATVGCGVSRDASGAGLLLLTHLNIPPATEIVLRLFMPREPDARRLPATVLRCEPIPPQAQLLWNHRIAISLHDPSPELQQLVSTLSKPPPPP
jgi:hypothetical protein